MLVLLMSRRDPHNGISRKNVRSSLRDENRQRRGDRGIVVDGLGHCQRGRQRRAVVVVGLALAVVALVVLSVASVGAVECVEDARENAAVVRSRQALDVLGLNRLHLHRAISLHIHLAIPSNVDNLPGLKRILPVDYRALWFYV